MKWSLALATMVILKLCFIVGRGNLQPSVFPSSEANHSEWFWQCGLLPTSLVSALWFWNYFWAFVGKFEPTGVMQMEQITDIPSAISLRPLCYSWGFLKLESPGCGTSWISEKVVLGHQTSKVLNLKWNTECWLAFYSEPLKVYKLYYIKCI